MRCILALFVAVLLASNSARAGEPAAPPAWPFFAMDTVRPQDNLDLLKHAGYVGFNTTVNPNLQQTLTDAKTHGLTVVGVYTGTKVTAAGLKNDQSELIETLKGTGAVIWLNLQSDDFKKSTPDGDAAAVPALRAMAERAKAAGLRIALYPHTGFWIERVQEAVRVAKQVDHPNFGVTFNLCHCLMVGDEEKIPALLKEAAPHLFMVTINGADTGAARTKWDRLIQPLDQGTFDVAAVLKELKAIGYKGPIGLQGYGVKVPTAENLERSWNAWRSLNERISKQ